MFCESFLCVVMAVARIGGNDESEQLELRPRPLIRSKRALLNDCLMGIDWLSMVDFGEFCAVSLPDFGVQPPMISGI